MYVEDIDYARRVTNLGKRVVYFPQITYIHFGGFNQNRIGMLIEGFRKYHNKNSGRTKTFFAILVLDVGLIARSFAYFLYSLVDRSKREHALLCLKALMGSR
jgi:GT2 family glycosyltransferase